MLVFAYVLTGWFSARILEEVWFLIWKQTFRREKNNFFVGWIPTYPGKPEVAKILGEGPRVPYIS